MGKPFPKNTARRLGVIYERLFEAFGPQYWWPGETPLEVAVGAVLTQNTNWGNVEKAIANLKNGGHLDASKLHRMPGEKLATLIRPAGYFNVKAKRLKSFINFLVSEHRGRVENMMVVKSGELRTRLLDVHGIGPETADSILLYALGMPFFVIDAYTKRVLSRHGILRYDAPYDAFQNLFHSCTEPETEFYNEYHALFVMLGKTYCKPKPVCSGCPLEGF